MVVVGRLEAGLHIQHIQTVVQISLDDALLVQHLDEVVRFGRLLVRILVQNTLIDRVSRLWEFPELVDLLVVGDFLRLIFDDLARDDVHKVYRLLQRHLVARDYDDLLEFALPHTLVEVLLIECKLRRVDLLDIDVLEELFKPERLLLVEVDLQLALLI